MLTVSIAELLYDVTYPNSAYPNTSVNRTARIVAQPSHAGQERVDTHASCGGFSHKRKEKRVVLSIEYQSGSWNTIRVCTRPVLCMRLEKINYLKISVTVSKHSPVPICSDT